MKRSTDAGLSHGPGKKVPKIAPDGRIVCDFFARFGNCKNEQSCKFAHTQSSERPDPSPSSFATAFPPQRFEAPLMGGRSQHSGGGAGFTLGASFGREDLWTPDKSLCVEKVSRPCDFFLKYGNCKNGDKCKFSHAGGGRSFGGEKPVPQQMMLPEFGPHDRFTESYAPLEFSTDNLGPPAGEFRPPIQNGGDVKRCDFMIKYGNCKNGDKCKFSHNLGGSSQHMNYGAAQHAAPMPSWQPLVHEYPGFATGYSPLALPFQSMSGGDPYRFPRDEPTYSNPRKSTQKHERKTNKDGKVICDFFGRFGNCTKGVSCPFLHEKSGGTPEKTVAETAVSQPAT